MKMGRSFVDGKGRLLLTLLFAFFFAGPVVYGETIEEDFEDVTIVDADGLPLANSWTPGAGLSNGWRIIGGTIYASDNGDYGLIHSAGAGFALSEYYLTSASTSVNNAYIYIPARLRGQVLLWARSNLTQSSKKTSTLKVYEATADGNVETDVLLYSATPVKGSSDWKPFYFTIEGEGKYIAINLVYTDIDMFSATVSDGTPVEPELTVSTDRLDFGMLTAAATQSFTVMSNVTTSVAFDITGSDHDAFEVVNAPTTLAAGVAKRIDVKMNAPEPGDYKATLKVTAGELTKKISLVGVWEEKPVEPDVPADWKGEDFNGLTDIPSTWTIANGASWGIDDWRLDTQPALMGYSGFICTPRFAIANGQTLEFYFQKGLSYGWSSKCTIYYSTDKETWTEVDCYDSYTADGTKTVTFPAAGSYYLGLQVNTTTYFDDFKIVGGDAPVTLPSVQDVISAIANGQSSVEYDVNHDGKTDIADIILILNNK